MPRIGWARLERGTISGGIYDKWARQAVTEETHEHQTRDWVSLLAPTLLAVVVTLAIQIGGYIWFMATLQTRVNNIELRVKVGEDVIQKLPSDYVPRVEHARNEALLKEQREDDQRRLDRLEGKIDLILEASRK